jgi:hypothetical protein
VTKKRSKGDQGGPRVVLVTTYDLKETSIAVPSSLLPPRSSARPSPSC